MSMRKHFTDMRKFDKIIPIKMKEVCKFQFVFPVIRGSGASDKIEKEECS